VRIRCPELDGTVYVDHGVSAPPGAVVWAAIRPEKMVMTRDKPDVTENFAHGIIKEIAYMGDASIYLIRLDSGKTVRVTQSNVWRQISDRVTWEEPVYLHWHATSPVVVVE
jgi:putrescine transport system ATP-binding protein